MRTSIPAPAAAETTPFVGYRRSPPHRYDRPMAHLAQTPHPGMSFVTLVTRDRGPIFQTSRLADIFIETLLFYRTHGHYKLHAFLVMPDRVHLLLTPQFHSLNQTIALIQKGFASRLDAGDVQENFWEPGYTAHPILNQRNLDTLRNYLHTTPVRADLAPTPELYPWSSAHRLPQKIAPLPTTTFMSEKAS